MNTKKIISALMCTIFALGVSFTTLGVASTAEASHKHHTQWEEPAPPPPPHHKKKAPKPHFENWR